MELTDSKPGLYSAIAIGVGSIIGSGWLFAPYFAAKNIGPAAYLTWILGAFIALVLAFFLAEIASMFKENALFSRLFVFSHDNHHMGFVIAISSWFGMVAVIPAEATATIEYLTSLFPTFKIVVMHAGHFKLLGKICIIALIFMFTLINFWGMKSMARANNIIALFKLCIPIITALLLLIFSHNLANFNQHGVFPMGFRPVVSGVLTCGIFYAFFGFSMVAMMSRELDKPRRNVPLALISSVLICLAIYLLLQTAFIFSMPSEKLTHGWHHLYFSSPFAQLLLLLNFKLLFFWSFALYFDSVISPSGTAIIYLGGAEKNLVGMAEDKQLPHYFSKKNMTFNLSRRALLFTAFICCLSVTLFEDWQEIMVIVSVFQLISCVAIPVAFAKLRSDKKALVRKYVAPMGRVFAFFIYLILSYFLVSAAANVLLLTFFLHIAFFMAYLISSKQFSFSEIKNAFLSSASLFTYMLLCYLYSALKLNNHFSDILMSIIFILSFSPCYVYLLKQKLYASP